MTKRRTTTLAGLALFASLALYGMAFADHKGLQSLFAARGTTGPFHIHDRGAHVKLKATRPIDVAIVAAQLHADGQTGWHTHPADSIVSVQANAPPLIMQRVRHGRCVERTFAAGEAFVHPAGPHNFRNSSKDQPLNFGVAYFVPVGATLLAPATDPNVCP